VLSFQNGDDVKTVQENLGHATAAFTLDVYGHVSEKMKKNSADRMQEYIGGIKQALNGQLKGQTPVSKHKKSL
jgi:site-specific recombinase XerD